MVDILSWWASDALYARQMDALCREQAKAAQEFYDKLKEPKMTREEAIKKLKDKLVLDRDSLHPANLVNALEVLGLIKFDEVVKNPLDGRWVTIKTVNGETVSGQIQNGKSFEDGLYSTGYEIVKKKPF